MLKLDLHRMKHQEVEREVIRVIEANWNKDVKAYIITGNSKQMKDIVINILNEYRLYYTIGDSLDVRNTGYITCII